MGARRRHLLGGCVAAVANWSQRQQRGSGGGSVVSNRATAAWRQQRGSTEAVAAARQRDGGGSLAAVRWQQLGGSVDGAIETASCLGKNVVQLKLHLYLSYLEQIYGIG